MNIEFYGSSIIGSNTFQPDKPKSFYDLILEHFNATSLNHMIAQCSEERILYNLKKTSEIDIAIIFHSTPQFIYFPNFTRDFVFQQDHEIDDWNNRCNYSIFDYVDAFKQNKKDIVHTDTGAYVPIEPVDNSIIKDFMKFHFNRDVNRNRFHGAVSLIDDYVYAKNIPTIHVIHNFIPDWFNFKSGIVDRDIWYIEREHSVSFNKSVNGISIEGNHLIFNKLKDFINEML